LEKEQKVEERVAVYRGDGGTSGERTPPEMSICTSGGESGALKEIESFGEITC